MTTDERKAGAESDTQSGEGIPPPEAVDPRGPDAGPISRQRLLFTTVGSTGLAFLIMGGLAGFVWVIVEVNPRFEFALSLLLLVAVLLFVTALTVMAAGYRALGLAHDTHALGLPEGSVRAILALMLVFLFFVAVLFLFGTLSFHESSQLEDVPLAQYNQLLSADRVLASVQTESAPEPLYDVTIATGPGQAAEDMAETLVTLLGTLVTAVAAFYFGANVAVSASRGWPLSAREESARRQGFPPQAAPPAEGDAAGTAAAGAGQPQAPEARVEE